MALRKFRDVQVPTGAEHGACLSPRQLAVLELSAGGLSDKQIATELGLSVRTVRDRFAELRQRTGARTRGELLACAAAAGLVHPVSRVWDCGRSTKNG